MFAPGQAVQPQTPLGVLEHEAFEERPDDIERESVLNGEIARVSRAAEVDRPARIDVDPDAERRFDAERLEKLGVDLQTAERAAREAVRESQRAAVSGRVSIGEQRMLLVELPPALLSSYVRIVDAVIGRKHRVSAAAVVAVGAPDGITTDHVRKTLEQRQRDVAAASVSCRAESRQQFTKRTARRGA